MAFPCWAHDSRHIYYLQIKGSWSLMRVSVPEGKPERVADLTGIRQTGFHGAYLALGPDDQPVLTRDAGSQEIYSIEWETP